MKQQIKTAWYFLKKAVKTIVVDIMWMFVLLFFVLVAMFGVYTYNNTTCWAAPEDTYACFSVYPDLREYIPNLE